MIIQYYKRKFIGLSIVYLLVLRTKLVQQHNKYNLRVN